MAEEEAAAQPPLRLNACGGLRTEDGRPVKRDRRQETGKKRPEATSPAPLISTVGLGYDTR
jgi:hypothetical protein